MVGFCDFPLFWLPLVLLGSRIHFCKAWTLVHIPTSHLLEIHPNIIHPSTPRSPHWSLSLRFSHQDSCRGNRREKPLGRPRRRWVDNIRMDLQEVGCGYMDWIGLAQDRDSWRTLVSAVMNLGVPWNAGNFLTSCKPVSFSRRTLHHGVSEWTLGFLSYPFSWHFLVNFCDRHDVFVCVCVCVYVCMCVCVCVCVGLQRRNPGAEGLSIVWNNFRHFAVKLR